ncbi:hypothetical protein BDV12DRAFT_198723 [Aspergillus spectabilis]
MLEAPTPAPDDVYGHTPPQHQSESYHTLFCDALRTAPERQLSLHPALGNKIGTYWRLSEEAAINGTQPTAQYRKSTAKEQRQPELPQTFSSQELQDKYQRLQDDHEQLQDEYQQLHNDREQLQDDLEKLQDDHMKLQRQLEGLQELHEVDTATCQDQGEALDGVHNLLNEALMEIEYLTEELNTLRSARKRSKALARVD